MYLNFFSLCRDHELYCNTVHSSIQTNVFSLPSFKEKLTSKFLIIIIIIIRIYKKYIRKLNLWLSSFNKKPNLKISHYMRIFKLNHYNIWSSSSFNKKPKLKISQYMRIFNLNHLQYSWGFKKISNN